LESFETLCSLAKEAEINPDAILLDQTEEGFTFLLITAEEKHVDLLQKLLDWA